MFANNQFRKPKHPVSPNNARCSLPPQLNIFCIHNSVVFTNSANKAKNSMNNAGEPNIAVKPRTCDTLQRAVLRAEFAKKPAKKD